MISHRSHIALINKNEAIPAFFPASFQNVANNWKKASYTSDINSEPEIAGKRIPK